MVLSPWDRPVPMSVGSGLLQEVTAKAARQPVKSERPGLPAGAFAFCGVRTAFCDPNLKSRVACVEVSWSGPAR